MSLVQISIHLLKTVSFISVIFYFQKFNISLIDFGKCEWINLFIIFLGVLAIFEALIFYSVNVVRVLPSKSPFIRDANFFFSVYVGTLSVLRFSCDFCNFVVVNYFWQNLVHLDRVYLFKMYEKCVVERKI